MYIKIQKKQIFYKLYTYIIVNKLYFLIYVYIICLLIFIFINILFKYFNLHKFIFITLFVFIHTNIFIPLGEVDNYQNTKFNGSSMCECVVFRCIYVDTYVCMLFVFFLLQSTQLNDLFDYRLHVLSFNNNTNTYVHVICIIAKCIRQV